MRLFHVYSAVSSLLLCPIQCDHLLIPLLHTEGIRNLLASIEWTYEDEEGAAGDYEAEGAG